MRRLEMASGVEVEHRQSELLAAAYLVEKCLPALFEFFGLGGAEIYQIAVVGKYGVGCESKLAAVGLERLGFGCPDGQRAPARRVAGEQRESGGANGRRVDRREAYSLFGRYVCSYQFHTANLAIIFDLYRSFEKMNKNCRSKLRYDWPMVVYFM